MHLEGERIPGRAGLEGTFGIRDSKHFACWRAARHARERENLERTGNPNCHSLDLRFRGPSEIGSRLLRPSSQTQVVLCIKKTELQEEIVQLGLLSSPKFWCLIDVAPIGRDHD